MRRVKIALLHVTKALGLFRLSKLLTKNGLRILGYHGISLTDEHRFRPKLFMRPETFRGRLALLARGDYPVLSLVDALAAMGRGELPSCAIVMTIDDGWYGAYKEALPALRENGFPATVYVCSYYAVKETQVFNVLVDYLFWRSTASSLDLSALECGLQGTCSLALADAAERARVMRVIVAHGEKHCSAEQRQALARSLARLLGIDWSSIERKGMFRLMTPGQIEREAKLGTDIQLHTHRHTLSLDTRAEVEREICDNRSALEPLVRRELEHFCYPSGLYHPRIWPWLEELGIQSATVTTAGFVYPGSPRFALTRFLDGEDVTSIEFEAELCGVLELLRRLRAFVRDRD